MKRRLRLALIAGVLTALMFGFLYEYSTHVMGGWLRGEAFYDGRPTSCWREQIDGWVARFDSLDDAERHLRSTSIISSMVPIPPRPTIWGRVCISLHLPALRTDAELPGILIGDPEAEAVWRELKSIPAYGSLVDQAKRNSVFWKFRQPERGP